MLCYLVEWDRVETQRLTLTSKSESLHFLNPVSGSARDGCLSLYLINEQRIYLF